MTVKFFRISEPNTYRYEFETGIVYVIDLTVATITIATTKSGGRENVIERLRNRYYHNVIYRERNRREKRVEVKVIEDEDTVIVVTGLRSAVYEIARYLYKLFFE